MAQLLDLDRPVAMLAIACLHFAAGDAEASISRYRDRLAPDSVLAVSHGSDDVDDPDHADRMRAVADTFAGTASPVTLRSRAQVRGLLGDFELAKPGLVDIADWPEPDPKGRSAATWAAVGVKPRG